MKKLICGFVASLLLGMSAQAGTLQCKIWDAIKHNEKTASVDLVAADGEDRVYVELNGYECQGAARKSLDGDKFVIHRLTFMVTGQRIVSSTPEKYKSLTFSDRDGYEATCSCEMTE